MDEIGLSFEMQNTLTLEVKGKTYRTMVSEKENKKSYHYSNRLLRGHVVTSSFIFKTAKPGTPSKLFSKSTYETQRHKSPHCKAIHFTMDGLISK